MRKVLVEKITNHSLIFHTVGLTKCSIKEANLLTFSSFHRTHQKDFSQQQQQQRQQQQQYNIEAFLGLPSTQTSKPYMQTKFNTLFHTHTYTNKASFSNGAIQIICDTFFVNFRPPGSPHVTFGVTFLDPLQLRRDIYN